MAFNIRSRAGWHRLWLVATIAWGGIAFIPTVQHFPAKHQVDAELQRNLSRLTPEAVAAHNRSAENTKRVEISLYGKPRDYPDLLLTPEKVAEQTKQAYDWHAYKLNTLGKRQAQAALKGLALWLAPSFFVYLCAWVLVWIGRGFAR